MSIFEVFLIGVSLSMDAFAVSVCKGLAMSKVNKKQALLLGIFFGGFQALMPLAGYFLGGLFYDYISKYGHWISFAVLGIIGLNMFGDGLKELKQSECIEKCDPRIRLGELFFLAVATSIDAFAVGVAFSLLSVNIYISAVIIGITTLILSIVAVYIGNAVGTKFGPPAKLAGGGVLIFIGARIVAEALL